MDVAILRLFTAYGPRQRPNLAFYSFLERIIARKPISIFGDGGSVRDYTFISDIVAGICACIVREIGFEIFNIGASQPVTLLEVVRLLEQETNAEALINYLPMQAGDMLVTSADISKARTKLGYNPQVSIQQGIRLFVKWYLEQSKTLNFPLNS
jgi:UDP-glucuronate 4-epimerase